MGRWEPNAAQRLRAAALELFAERGYDPTTVADIAERAGLTPRTFFRHFADKREVLFAGSQDLEQAMVTALREAPTSTTPWDAVGAALQAGAAILGRDRGLSRWRQDLLDSHPDLRGRELTKLAALATAMAGGLRERGVLAADAELAAEAGILVFRLAFAAWLSEPTADDPRPDDPRPDDPRPDDQSLAQVMSAAMTRMRAL